MSANGLVEDKDFTEDEGKPGVFAYAGVLSAGNEPLRTAIMDWADTHDYVASVLVRAANGTYFVYTKDNPEPN